MGRPAITTVNEEHLNKDFMEVINNTMAIINTLKINDRSAIDKYNDIKKSIFIVLRLRHLFEDSPTTNTEETTLQHQCVLGLQNIIVSNAILIQGLLLKGLFNLLYDNRDLDVVEKRLVEILDIGDFYECFIATEDAHKVEALINMFPAIEEALNKTHDESSTTYIMSMLKSILY